MYVSEARNHLLIIFTSLTFTVRELTLAMLRPLITVCTVNVIDR